MLADVALQEHAEDERFENLVVTLFATQLQFKEELFEAEVAHEQEPLVLLVEQLTEAILKRVLEAQQLQAFMEEFIGLQ